LKAARVVAILTHHDLIADRAAVSARPARTCGVCWWTVRR